jgi:hypothetical protein
MLLLATAAEIAMLRFARAEAFVASFHLLDDFIRRHLVTLLLGEVCVGQHVPRLASTTPTAVTTPAALQKVRRSNRSLPSPNLLL